MADSGARRAGQNTWQERLEEQCRSVGASPPEFNIVSDRRGGRTAWSATVSVASLAKTFQARFWYDGQYVNNAREDAAEVAFRYMATLNPQAGGVPRSASPASLASSNNGMGLRAAGGGPALGASNMLPPFGDAGSQRHANAVGVAWNRTPTAQQGFSRPGW